MNLVAPEFSSCHHELKFGKCHSVFRCFFCDILFLSPGIIMQSLLLFCFVKNCLCIINASPIFLVDSDSVEVENLVQQSPFDVLGNCSSWACCNYIAHNISTTTILQSKVVFVPRSFRAVKVCLLQELAHVRIIT